EYSDNTHHAVKLTILQNPFPEKVRARAILTYEDNKLIRIQAGLTLPHGWIDDLTEQDKEKFASFAKPFLKNVKPLPATLKLSCGLNFKDEDLELKCRKSLCVSLGINY